MKYIPTHKHDNLDDLMPTMRFRWKKVYSDSLYRGQILQQYFISDGSVYLDAPGEWRQVETVDFNSPDQE